MEESKHYGEHSLTGQAEYVVSHGGTGSYKVASNATTSSPATVFLRDVGPWGHPFLGWPPFLVIVFPAPSAAVGKHELTHLDHLTLPQSLL